MARPPRTLLITLALAGLLGLSACGDDSDNTDASAASADCETVTVVIPEFTFDPDPVQVDACDQIVWRNGHDQSHTSTSNGDFSWSTGNIAAGADADPITFDTPGEFTYMCALHPFMKGTVEVS